MIILAGDIGGTKTHLALAQVDGSIVHIAHEARFSSKSFTNLSEMIKGFLENAEKAGFGGAHFACFGVAGPVRDGVVQVTNLPWTVEAAKLRVQLNLNKVFLLNDLEANAYGIETLLPDEMVSINPRADFNQEGNRGLIAAGTGLGEAGLYWDGKRHHPFATEGGHASFAPNDSIGMNCSAFCAKNGVTSVGSACFRAWACKSLSFLSATCRYSRTRLVEGTNSKPGRFKCRGESGRDCWRR